MCARQALYQQATVLPTCTLLLCNVTSVLFGGNSSNLLKIGSGAIVKHPQNNMVKIKINMLMFLVKL
jgi:hypothetical protein